MGMDGSGVVRCAQTVASNEIGVVTVWSAPLRALRLIGVVEFSEFRTDLNKRNMKSR